MLLLHQTTLQCSTISIHRWIDSVCTTYNISVSSIHIDSAWIRLIPRKIPTSCFRRKCGESTFPWNTICPKMTKELSWLCMTSTIIKVSLLQRNSLTGQDLLMPELMARWDFKKKLKKTIAKTSAEFHAWIMSGTSPTKKEPFSQLSSEVNLCWHTTKR